MSTIIARDKSYTTTGTWTPNSGHYNGRLKKAWQRKRAPRFSLTLAGLCTMRACRVRLLLPNAAVTFWDVWGSTFSANKLTVVQWQLDFQTRLNTRDAPKWTFVAQNKTENNVALGQKSPNNFAWPNIWCFPSQHIHSGCTEYPKVSSLLEHTCCSPLIVK